MGIKLVRNSCKLRITLCRQYVQYNYMNKYFFMALAFPFVLFSQEDESITKTSAKQAEEKMQAGDFGTIVTIWLFVLEPPRDARTVHIEQNGNLALAPQLL